MNLDFGDNGSWNVNIKTNFELKKGLKEFIPVSKHLFNLYI